MCYLLGTSLSTESWNEIRAKLERLKAYDVRYTNVCEIGTKLMQTYQQVNTVNNAFVNEAYADTSNINIFE